MEARRGIVLLEVLAAAVILAVAAVALVELQEGALSRSESGARAIAVARAAQRLAEEAAIDPELMPGTESGSLDAPPGAAWTRTVEFRGDDERTVLVRINVEVTYPLAGSEEVMNLEKWLFRKRESKGNT